MKPRLAARPSLLLVLLACLSACGAHNPYYDPARRHHTPEGFRNNYPMQAPSRSDTLRWQWERWRDGLPPAPQDLPTPVEPDLAALAHPGPRPAVTWIGHATVLLQVAGRNVLTDPQFSERASPFSFAGPKRAQPPGVPLASLPHIDLVLISHNHYDHLDQASLAALARQAGGAPELVVPLGIETWMAEEVPEWPRDRIHRFDWWDGRAFGELRTTLVPVQHWSARGLFDRNETLWGGWVLEAPDFRFFFSGDLGYSRDVADIAARFPQGFDFAAIAIGAYEPRWFMHSQHVDPTEAVRVFRELKVRRALGIHWGTFALTDEPLDQPPRDLAQARAAQGVAESDFFVLRHGETRVLP
ncbi:MBL fold metallo-hydrolase [Niveibacterium sp. SC-1]|uniref:MBL fold metallo-hydrolase n=1 Tax=Niveibacterium sp. SC-1 TaxID=3135646 RepID=UPI00311D5E51